MWNWPAPGLGVFIESVVIILTIVLAVVHQLSPELTGALVITAIAATKL